ncbi:TonB-dependent siderophore receptor [Allorhizobium sp. BGMRC 0089]|uniref:TonB-dependent siderophore receptor n=1 Tax=Allorhizobium sonneratiae TaxID=2934936 RepID=UPI002033F7CF|nr:TonB-dependent siderophore receptor [Allorhizobium sonneratiae]MCM2293112.1 TonB-dependent siderophore receptor [Allorhizobium sonneratiae]
MKTGPKNRQARFEHAKSGFIYASTALAVILSMGVSARADETKTAANGNGSATELTTIEVNSKASGTASADNTKITAKDASSATKTDTPLIKTARSVSVITKKELEERGAQDIIEAVRYTAGVQTGPYGFDPRFDQIIIRGNDITTTGDYRDGLWQPYMNYGTFRTDPYALDRVEVVKGPVSVLYGAGDPGGIINKTSKLPTEESIHEVGFLWGTTNRRQTMFDFGGPISKDNDNVLYRLVGVFRKGDTNFDIADDRYLIQPAITIKRDETTKLTLFANAQYDETDANVGALTGPDGNVYDLRDSDPRYDYQKIRQQQIGYKFEHEFDGGLTFRQTLRYSHMDLRSRYLQTDSWTGDIANRHAYSIRDAMSVFQIDNQLEAKFDTGPASHTALFGVDYTNVISSFGYGADYSTDYTLNLNDPVYGVTGTTPPYNYSTTDNNLHELGVYGLDQVEWGRWNLSFGGRETWVNQKSSTTLVSDGTTTNDDLSKHAFSSQVGLLYLFDNGIAPFVSYATSFQPVTNRSASGAILDPSKGTQYEAGIKYQPPGTSILLTATAYHLVESNKPVLVDPLTLVYDSLGEVTNKGIELEAKATIADGLDVIASYTYNHSEITGGDNVGNQPAVTPAQMASLWTNYTFQEGSVAHGLSIGGGLRFSGSNFTDTDNTAKNPSSFYVDAGISYDFGAINQKYKGLTAAFDVRNIANRRNTICNSGYCYLGQGRNMTASLKYRW